MSEEDRVPERLKPTELRPPCLSCGGKLGYHDQAYDRSFCANCGRENLTLKARAEGDSRTRQAKADHERILGQRRLERGKREIGRFPP